MSFDRGSVCDVCRNEVAVKMARSPLGPFVVSYGTRCVAERAEMLPMLYAMLDCAHGTPHIASWMKTLRSYKDGAYIDWDEIVASHSNSAGRKAA